MDLLDTAAVGLKEPLAITWSGLLLIPQPPLHARRHVRNAHLTCPTTRKQHRREWSVIYHPKTHLSETFRMFFRYFFYPLQHVLCLSEHRGSHKRINVLGWRCTWVKLFACCIWVYLAPFTIMWRWRRGRPEVAHYFSPFSLFRTRCSFWERVEYCCTRM